MGMMTAQQAADLIAPCFEGVKAKKSLHFCNGNLRGRPISHTLHCAPWVNMRGIEMSAWCHTESVDNWTFLQRER